MLVKGHNVRSTTHIACRANTTTGRRSRGIAFAAVFSLLVGFVASVSIGVAVAPSADAQNPCSGTRIYVYQVEADPWSDWDGDGISNIDEVNSGAAPCARPCTYLTAVDIQLNPRGDWDGDGVDNQSEHQNGFNPCSPDQFNVVPSNSRSSAPTTVTATAVPAPPPTATPAPPPPPPTATSIPVATAAPALIRPTPLPTPTVASIDGELAEARALLEAYDRAQEEAARATPTPQPTATVEPTVEPEPTATPVPTVEADPTSTPEPDPGTTGDESNEREIAADNRDIDGDLAASASDTASDADTAPAETSGGVTIAVEQPCTRGVAFDGQCLRLLPMTLVVVSAGAVVGATWWFDWRKNRPVQPSLKLFD